MFSRGPPEPETMTGKPLACASSTTFPAVSVQLGNTKQSADANASATATRDKAPVKTEDFSRLFLVPGMGHCSGGERALDRFNMLEAVVNWVEQKRPPDQVIATGAALPGVSRPLCPFPKHAHYAGSGDPNLAASYSCRE